VTVSNVTHPDSTLRTREQDFGTLKVRFRGWISGRPVFQDGYLELENGYLEVVSSFTISVPLNASQTHIPVSISTKSTRRRSRIDARVDGESARVGGPVARGTKG
jgi:hypothetical protein